MIKKITLTLFYSTFLLVGSSFGQEIPINQKLKTTYWPSYWVAHPTASPFDYGVYHFRKSFGLDTDPEAFIIHISADNRYELFVNGERVVLGPARGDRRHWYFETVDIARYLKSGENLLAVLVYNMGEFRPAAQMTLQTGLIIQGDTKKEEIVNTNESWKVFHNKSYLLENDSLGVGSRMYFTGPGDIVNGQAYPWGWETMGYDDSHWTSVKQLFNGVPIGEGTDGLWMLEPRNIPVLDHPEVRLDKIRRTDHLDLSDDFLKGEASKTIPPNTSCKVLFDQGVLTSAYPEISLSGGEGSTVRMTYAEALFDDKNRKGNRDDITGKSIRGQFDIFLPDGGHNRVFRPLWFRTYRYLELAIETGSEPLEIQDLKGTYYGYPLEEKATFKAVGNEQLDQIWEVGWRTAKLCAGETYFDCPYYEQLQYVGDTRIQALISLYISGDDRLMRKAILDFDRSRLPNGLTQSRYPSWNTQVIPPYSLFWVAMVYDYWMHRDNPEFVRQFLPGIRGVLQWYEDQVDETGMLGSMIWWHFVDWPDEWGWDDRIRRGGEPTGVKEGNSSILSLQYAYVLKMASELHQAFDEDYFANLYHDQAVSVTSNTRRLCWDNDRGLLADTPKKDVFSQHANVTAILADMFDDNEARTVLSKVLMDSSLIQTTMYYHFYLIRALVKANMADLYLEQLDQWYTMLDLGLTTFAERPEPTRSDCHAWSASPNYDFLATVCGIKPSSPGFKTVKIEPILGDLKKINASMPHPMGEIRVSLAKKGQNGIKGTISLPAGLSGSFEWRGRILNIENEVKINL